MPSSDDSPPEEDGGEIGGEGGIPNSLVPRIGVLIVLVVLYPRGFESRLVPSSCSQISKKSKG
jgi:hypothetical protein